MQPLLIVLNPGLIRSAAQSNRRAPGFCCASKARAPNIARQTNARPSSGLWADSLGQSARGHLKRLGQLVPNAVVASAAYGGTYIRAALYPPVGLGDAPEDIGAMPEIARALECWRTTKKNDEQRARLEELENGPYINMPPTM